MASDSEDAAELGVRAVERIRIRDLLVRCTLGVSERERSKPQDVVFNIVLDADLGGAIAHDRLEATVDYKALKQRVMAEVESSAFHLLESLAGRVAEICLADRRVHRVAVTADKPGALRFARSVAAEVVRERPRSSKG